MFSFTNKKKQQQHSNKKTEADDMSSRRPRPRLDRRNANKNIDYDAITSSASTSLPHPPSPSSPDYHVRATRSLDLSPNIYSNQTSFRIAGSIDGEVDLICRSLGLSGPEDFAISASAWEASRARSRLSTTHPDPDPTPIPPPIPPNQDSVVAVRVREEGGIKGVRPPTLTTPEAMSMSIEMRSAPPTVSVSVPPPMMKTNPSPSSVLSPPPSISLPEIEKVGSTWDLVMAFAPEEEGERRRFKDYDDEEEKEEVGVKLGEETSEDVDITSTSNDDDSSSSTTEAMFVISPNGRFKRNIKSWMKGQMLGSGSFGTVYEGISDEGVFFAVKEVSLLDQKGDAQQCILQLEQEIELLSQFEHENIVQYYGTDKGDAKLFIFIELVTQGSLASLYQKYHLREGHISAYTRQILQGLNYLHERNVVHRDIKCANILVHANGSVKLADFGLAKEMKKVTVLRSCKGSVYWMAPEVVNPKMTYGRSADIWSLGCTVLEMLTRQIPYPNLEWQHAFFKIGRGEQPHIPSNLSDDARDFITQCVRVNPDDRPAARELLDHPFVRRALPAVGSGSDYSSSPRQDR